MSVPPLNVNLLLLNGSIFKAIDLSSSSYSSLNHSYVGVGYPPATQLQFYFKYTRLNIILIAQKINY